MKPVTSRRRQAGATLVEFVLGLVLFLTVFLGVIDVARLLWTWSAANEATLWGARLSVVCEKGAPGVLRSMQTLVPQLQDQHLKVDWYSQQGLDNACTQASCTAVKVSISGLSHVWISPMGWLAGGVVPMPEFSTHLFRESMGLDPASQSFCS